MLIALSIVAFYKIATLPTPTDRGSKRYLANTKCFEGMLFKTQIKGRIPLYDENGDQVPCNTDLQYK